MTETRNQLVTIEATPLPAPTAMDPMVAMIQRVALDPDIDISKLERMLDMKERLDAAAAEREFTAAMSAAQAEIEPIARDRKNSPAGYKYTTLEAIAKAVAPIVARHGFATTFGSDASPIDGHYRVTCELRHSAGHTKAYHADVPIDGAGLKGGSNKTAVQAFGSTMTYARRYLLLLIWNISTEDNDGQAPREVQTISAKQLGELNDLIAKTETDVSKFLAFAKADSMEDIPASAFGRLVSMLNAKLKDSSK